MNHRSLGPFALAFLLTAASLGQPAPATQPRSSVDYREDLVEIFQARMLQNVQLRDQPWAETARKMVLLTAQSLADDRLDPLGWPADAARPDELARIADQLIAAKCENPNILFCCMRAYIRVWRDDDARAIATKLREVPAARFTPAITFPLVDDFTALSTDQADWKTLPGRRTQAMRTVARNATTEGRFNGSLLRLVLAYVRENDARYANLTGEESIAAQTARAAGVDPWLSNMLKGRALITDAWRVRGSRFAVDVDPAAWPVFAANLDDATIHLTEAANSRPNLPESWARLITAAMGSGKPTMPQFEKAIAAEIDHYEAWGNIIYAHYPRWGGSHQRMLEIGLRGKATERYDTLAPYRFVETAMSMERDRIGMGGPTSVWENAKLVDQTIEVFNKYIDAAGQSDRAARFLGLLIDHAMACGRFTEARDAAVRLAKLPPPYKSRGIMGIRDVWLSRPHAYASEQLQMVQEAVKLLNEHDSAGAKAACERALAALPQDHPGRLYIEHLLTAATAEIQFQTGQWVDLTPTETMKGWECEGGEWKWVDGAFQASADGEGIALSSQSRFKGPMEVELKLDVPRPTVDNSAMIGLCLLGRTDQGRTMLEAYSIPLWGIHYARLTPAHNSQTTTPAQKSIAITMRIAGTGVTVSHGGDFRPLGDAAATGALLNAYLQPMILQPTSYKAANMRIVLRNIRVRKLAENQ